MTGWTERRLDECLSALLDYRGKSPTKSATGIPVISAKVVKSGIITHPIAQTIAPSYYSEWMRRGLPKIGDVVMTTEGPLGEVAQLDERTAKYALGQRIVVMRGKTGVLDSGFLKFLLQTSLMQSRLHSHATGTTVLGISQKSLREISIPLPPYPVQLVIAGILSALDDKIELNRRMNETLEQMAQAIFKDWFVDFGPVRRKQEGASDPIAIMGGLVQNPARAAELAALFPDAFGDDGLPHGWTDTSVYSYAKVIYGAPFASSRFNSDGIGRPLIRIRDLPNHRTDVFTDEVHSKEYVVSAGDIVVGMDGEFRARLWLGLDSLMNQRVCCFVPLQRNHRAFLLFAIRPWLEQYEKSAIGTTVIHLGKKDIDSFRVTKPHGAIIAAFAAIAEPLLSRLVVAGAESRTLAETRDYLLPKLMSGEVRVRDALELCS